MQSEAEWWWCRSQTTVLLFVYSIALASFTSDERIHASKIMKVVFIWRVYPAEQKRLSIRNFRPPHSIYSAVFQIGKTKKKKNPAAFCLGNGGGWRSLSAWPTKICIPAALHWQALKWHQSSRLTLKACSQNVKLVLWFLQFCVFKVFPLQLSTHVRRLFPPRDYFIEVQQVD